MVDGEIKNGSAAFSWADEVEKEEEEQARFQEHQKQKPNPFGSARPREVVLQEKGIDWRKFDFDCQLPSHIRQLDGPKEKIPVSAAPGIDRIHSETPSKCLKLELDGANSDLKRSEILRVPLAVWNQIPVPFVPPLRYPPKNVIPSLSESGFHYYLHESGKGQQDFKNKRPLKPEKENASHQQGSQRVHCSQNNRGSHILPHYHRQILQAGQGSQFKENYANFKLGKSVVNGKNSRKTAASRIQHSDSAIERPSKKSSRRLWS
ncbi:hypothetical protein OIU79_019752 [Salix purpurea]|uniref:Uncharacterized protein n=1 Tax=Salix purpurea TaxID=77065 RepID=A0A9Q0SK86_SALPP|nr:hypothetical protein OIU79_019752 [Salix purpurea]